MTNKIEEYDETVVSRGEAFFDGDALTLTVGNLLTAAEEPILQEIGQTMERQTVADGGADYGCTLDSEITSNYNRYSVQTQSGYTTKLGTTQDYQLYTVYLSAGQTVTVDFDCTLFQRTYAYGYIKITTRDANGNEQNKTISSYGGKASFTLTQSTQFLVQTVITSTDAASFNLRAQYNISVKYVEAKPDMAPLQLNGWDAPIVVSTTTGTNANASSITTEDNVYVDFAFWNQGGGFANTTYVEFFIDGKSLGSIHIDGADSYDYWTIPDLNLGRLAAGQHEVKMVLDSTGALTESNESNNTYVKTFSVTGNSQRPDLAEYAPNGWSGSIVTSIVTGTNTNASKITTADNVYVDLAFGNDYAAIGNEFYVALVLDDEIIGAWTVGSMSADSYSTIKDFDIGKLSAGEHTLLVMLDPTEEISETNENNNIFYKTFTVTQKSVSADTYESGTGDNSRFKATKLAVGQTQSHTIHSKTDEDWMVFEVAEDGFYSVVTSGGDTVLQLYSFENQAFCYNDDRGNGDTGSFDTVQLYAGTKYYARVTGKGGALISYDIAVTKGAVKDPFEKNNDDAMSGASLLAAGQTQSHTIDSATDVDWIKFMVEEKGSYFFSIGTSERYDGQIAIEIYGSSGNKIDLSGHHDLLHKLSGENPYIAAEYGPGMYYVKVTSAHGNAAGLYSANLTRVSTFDIMPADDYEDDAHLDTMSEIRVGQTQTHSLNVWSSGGEAQLDVDLIKFTPTETGTYAIQVSNSDAPTHMTVYVTDDYGLLVPVAGDNRINPFVENYFQAGQTYVIQMENDYLCLNVERYDITVTKTSSYTSEKDNYEGDDTRSAAKTISLAESQAHSIHTVGDQDWVKFTPSSSGYYTFYTGARNGNAGDPDMVLGLYDANGKLLANDDNSFACWNAMVAYELKAGQTYYLQAQAARANTVVPYYTITVAKGVIEDSFDIYMDERSVTDDTMDTAMRIDLNTPTAHTLHSTSDVDWMWFEISEDGDYTIQTTGNGDTYIRLYDLDGNLLAVDDDGGVGKNASVTMHLTVDPAYGTGLYIAEVSSYHGEVIPLYYAMVTKADGTAGDAYEDDDSRAKAKGIVAGESQSRSIHDAGDEDWVLFRPIQSGAYQIQTNGDGDMKLDLYDAKGNLIASDDDSGTGLNARLGQTLLANTDYYIKAYAYKKDVTIDSYALNVTLLQTSELGDAYESDDDPAKAKAIKTGETQTHSIHIAGDVDWVTFTPTVSAEYTVQTIGSGLNCDTQLYIYKSLADAQTGKVLQWDDDSGADRNALVSRVFEKGVTYYIKAQAWGDYTLPSYGLKVTQNNGSGAASGVNADEYESDNKSGECKPIAVGREYTHSIHLQSDTDWVRFYTHQTGTYTIQTTGDSDMSFIVYKRIPGGALVPYENGVEITNGGSGQNALYRTKLESDNWYYVRVTTNGRRSTTSSYGIRVDIDSSSVKGDAYETAGGKANDNAASRATWMTPGAVQTHSIHTPGDTDWYSYKASNSASVVFSAANDENKEMRLFLYRKAQDGSLTYLTESDWGSYGFTSVTLDASAGETYYLRAQARSSTQTVGSYRLTSTYVKDSYEDDDTSAKATELKLGVSQTHNIHAGTDVDWYKFVVSSSATYEFETTGNGDTLGILYKANGSANVEVARSSSNGVDANMKISQSLSSGTYYLRVSGENNSVVDSYAVTVRRPVSKIDEPNDTKSNATTLAVGSRKTGSFHSTSDVDWYKISNVQSGVYTFKASNSSVNLEVYLGSSSTAAAAGRGSAEVTLASTGTIYVKATDANGDLVDTYSIDVTREEVANKAENYVVLFSGGGAKADNWNTFATNFKWVFDALRENYGIEASHIYVLYADGTDNGIDMANYVTGYYENTDVEKLFPGANIYSATKANLTSVMNTLASKTDSNDHVLVYTFDHGTDFDDEVSTAHGGEAIVPWNPQYKSDFIFGSDFANMAKKINAGYQTYLFAQCFSGGILDALNMSRSGIKIYGAAASDHWHPASAGFTSNDRIDRMSFNYQMAQAFIGSVSTTSALTDYAKKNPYRSGDGGYEAGSNFQIFAQA